MCNVFSLFVSSFRSFVSLVQIRLVVCSLAHPSVYPSIIWSLDLSIIHLLIRCVLSPNLIDFSGVWESASFWVLMPIRIKIRISILMPIRIRIGIKTMPILMRILPQVLQILENHIFFTFCHFTMSNVPYVIQYLDSILKFLEKSLLYQFFHLLGIDTDPDRAKWCGSGTDPDPDPQHWIFSHSFAHDKQSIVIGTRSRLCRTKTEQIYNWKTFFWGKTCFYITSCASTKDTLYQLQRKTPPSEVNILFFKTCIMSLFFLSGGYIGFPRTPEHTVRYPTESLPGSNSFTH